MKLKDINLFKTKPKAELQAMLPGLLLKLQELKLKQANSSEVKYKIALIKTLCNN
ncbi:MAG: hypothetical protein U1C50_00340 [Patescibacteria group bacterium]|nr:hypothetical protein [Patescibacteria group bacterium]